jgi:hypothetical protein
MQGKAEKMGQHRERIQGGGDWLVKPAQQGEGKRQGFGISRHKCAPVSNTCHFILSVLCVSSDGQFPYV